MYSCGFVVFVGGGEFRLFLHCHFELPSAIIILGKILKKFIDDFDLSISCN